jgi:Clostripain family
MIVPTSTPVSGNDKLTPDRLVFAVYAPFGTDETLSTYPDGRSRELAQHPLFSALLKVSEHGVAVAALIDLAGDDTYLVEIPAGKPEAVRVISRWKQTMSSPNTLRGFLRRVHVHHPDASIVLAMEGHGAGFLPEIDARQLTAKRVTDDGRFQWRFTNSQGTPVVPDPPPPDSSPLLPQGSPLLPQGSPLLPQGSPLLPVNHMPLSTWGVGAGLRAALECGVPKLPVIHFNNCFNMSVEVMHTVAPYAEFAAGYCNYNFFSAGQTYPEVFRLLRQQGSASPEQLAQWFADQNGALLAAKGNHPTIGCVLQLSRMKEVTERIDDVADGLLAALQGALPADRPGLVETIRKAIVDAKQYDTEPGFQLETPDQLTDIGSFAATLTDPVYASLGVAAAAGALLKALEGIWRYGATDRPWVDTNVTWDFTDKRLAMNILLPDPTLVGLWDWRSPFYLEVNPDPNLPMVQPHIIDFVKVTDWVDFIIEYHRDAPFIGLLPASIPSFPVFNAKFVPPRDGDGPKDPPGNPTRPNDPPKLAS